QIDAYIVGVVDDPADQMLDGVDDDGTHGGGQLSVVGSAGSPAAAGAASSAGFSASSAFSAVSAAAAFFAGAFFFFGVAASVSGPPSAAARAALNNSSLVGLG